jgi:hypothetical protein
MATGGGAEQRTWIPNRRAPQEEEEEEEEEDHPPTKDDEPPKSTHDALPEIISRSNLGLIVPKQQARLLWTHKRSQQNWSLIEICNKLLDEKLAPTLRTTDVMISPHTQKNKKNKKPSEKHTRVKTPTPLQWSSKADTRTRNPKELQTHMQINRYPKRSVFRQKLQTKTRVTAINWWRKRWWTK